MIAFEGGSRTVRSSIVAVCVVAGIAGCASVLGIDSDRHVDEATDGGAQDGSNEDVATNDAANVDAAPDASPYPAGWECLGSAVPPTPDASVDLQLVFDDVSGGGMGTPITGAEIHWCNQLDITCTNPHDNVVTDDAGSAVLTVPGGFNGYYEVDAGSYLPAVLSRTPQLSSESQGQGLANAQLVDLGPMLAGVTQNPSDSIAIVSAADCATTVAAGIVFTVGTPGPNEQVVYLVNNLPSPSATQTDSVSGSALVFNVPPGTLTLSASFAASGNPIRTVTTIARQGWVTFVQIRPDQATHMAFDGG